jgi:DNA-binding winged helix-turn-helix (wHTH) protein
MRRVEIVYNFGYFRLLAGEGMLYCAEKPIALTPKAFEVLRLLVENCGHLVKKGEFMEMVWPDTMVEDANLAQTVFTLRKALGESHRDHQSHEYIETVARRGYRFIAHVKITEELTPGFRPDRFH